MGTDWRNALWEAAVDFVIDLCQIVPAAFIGVGLVLNEGKDVMMYVVYGLPFLAIAFIMSAVRKKMGR
jgi:hypothetical protein